MHIFESVPLPITLADSLADCSSALPLPIDPCRFLLSLFYSLLSPHRLFLLTLALPSLITFHADNSPTYTRMQYILAKSRVLSPIHASRFLASSGRYCQLPPILRYSPWHEILPKSGVNTSPPVSEYEGFMLRNSINLKLLSSDRCKLFYRFNTSTFPTLPSL